MVLPPPGLCDVVPSLLPLGTVVPVWLAAASATAAVPSPATAKLPTAITVVKRAASCFPLFRVAMAWSNPLLMKYLSPSSIGVLCGFLDGKGTGLQLPASGRMTVTEPPPPGGLESTWIVP